jgi:hypothetical protein
LVEAVHQGAKHMYFTSQAGGRGRLTSWQVDLGAKTEKNKKPQLIKISYSIKIFFKSSNKKHVLLQKGLAQE